MTKKPLTKARIKFCKFENALAMQVLYMDKRFRSEYSFVKCFTIFPFRIISDQHVSFDGINLELWGCDQDKDRKIIIYKSDFYIEDILNKLDIALSIWAKNWEGWADEPAIKPIFRDAMGNEFERLDDVKGCVVEVEV